MICRGCKALDFLKRQLEKSQGLFKNAKDLFEHGPQKTDSHFSSQKLHSLFIKQTFFRCCLAFRCLKLELFFRDWFKHFFFAFLNTKSSKIRRVFLQRIIDVRKSWKLRLKKWLFHKRSTKLVFPFALNLENFYFTRFRKLWHCTVKFN